MRPRSSSLRRRPTASPASVHAAASAHVQLVNEIRQSLKKLSPRLRQVAEYILAHYERASFLSAAQLGRAAGVSEATVVRFAMTLGYPGYSKFQEVLQDIVQSRLTTVDRLRLVTDRTATRSIAARVIEADLKNLQLTLRDLDDAAFRDAVGAVRGARKILVLGFKGAAALALLLGRNLNRILGNVQVEGGSPQDLWEDLVHFGPGDLVIGISFPRYIDATVRAVAQARRQGCRVVVLTDSVLSPLSRYADVVLTARHANETYVNSFVAPLSLINALLAAVSVADKSRAASAFRRLEDVWDRGNVYYRSSSDVHSKDVKNGTGGHHGFRRRRPRGA